MALVETLRTKKEVQAIYKQLLENGKQREAEMFKIGCHCGLRFGDMSLLKMRDVLGAKAGEKVLIKESKTGKKRRILINGVIKHSAETLDRYYRKEHPYKPIEFMFQSTANCIGGIVKPISHSYFQRVIKKAAKDLAYTLNISSHTMRKTFGYQMFKRTGDIHMVQKILNHSNAYETLAYIGVTGEIVDRELMSLNLMR